MSFIPGIGELASAQLKKRFLAAALCSCASVTILTASVLAAAPELPAPEAPVPTAPAEPEPLPLTVVSRDFDYVTETLPHSTLTVYDDTMYSDESEITQTGCDGLMAETWLVVLRDGEETERFPIRRATLIEPQDEIVTVGSLPGSRYDSRGFYIWPTTGVISSGFGPRSISNGSSNHQGIDIATPVGTEVHAADGGEVIYAQDSGKSGYGILVKLLHDDGTVTYYAHLSKTLVEVGDRVAQDDLIALSGATGNVTGPHVHFEIRPNGGNPVNPASYLDGKPERN